MWWWQCKICGGGGAGYVVVAVQDMCFISLHLSSSLFISLHLSSPLFISLHRSPYLHISLHLSSSLFISFHLSSSPFISLHLSSSLFISLHLSSSLFLTLPHSSSLFLTVPLSSSLIMPFLLGGKEGGGGYFVYDLVWGICLKVTLQSHKANTSLVSKRPRQVCALYLKIAISSLRNRKGDNSFINISIIFTSFNISLLYSKRAQTRERGPSTRVEVELG
jgi:hypothetical protein